MGSSKVPPLRSLPRIFLPGADPSEPMELPKEEVEKLRKVLRLSEGDQIAVLPNDGTLVRCEFRSRMAHPLETHAYNTEPELKLTLAQALPKADKIDTIIRMGTEIGVSRFILFPSERSVVRWEPEKLQERLRRMRAIAREAAEQSFRSRLPEIESEKSLQSVLGRFPEAIVLSEVEGISKRLEPMGMEMTVVVGPEGGWAPRELEQIGERGVSLGPLVLRADTAGPAAAAVLLLR
jgi:16S rRNA (uracil1498-N3)-methyltransferase